MSLQWSFEYGVIPKRFVYSFLTLNNKWVKQSIEQSRNLLFIIVY